jgi:DNA polymerase-3 subunit epsilon
MCGVRVGIAGDQRDLEVRRSRAQKHGESIAARITKTVVWMAMVTPDANDAYPRRTRCRGAAAEPSSSTRAP